MADHTILRAVDISAAPTVVHRGGKHDAELRAKIAERTKAALAGPIVRARMSYMAKQAWTPERRARQRERFLALLNQANFERRRRHGLEKKQADTDYKRKIKTAMAKARRAPGHPFAILPPMSKVERNRYRYLRSMTTRDQALAVVMMEREASSD